MTKTYWISLVVGVVVLVGGYFIYQANTTTDSGVDSEISEAKSLRDLMSLAAPQKCTTSYQDDNVEVSGTVYITKDKVRGDFNTTSMAGPQVVHFILRDGINHTWLDGLAFGFKAEVLPTGEIGGEQNGESKMVSLDQDADYDCDSWAVDESMFVLPSNINFTGTPTL